MPVDSRAEQLRRSTFDVVRPQIFRIEKWALQDGHSRSYLRPETHEGPNQKRGYGGPSVEEFCRILNIISPTIHQSLDRQKIVVTLVSAKHLWQPPLTERTSQKGIDNNEQET